MAKNKNAYQGKVLKKDNMSVDEITSSINKKFGDIIFKGSDFKSPNIIPFGNPLIDYGLFEIGGIPEGKIIQLYGPESGGKTTLAMLACRNYLERNPDKIVAVIDLENGIDNSYIERTGINRERLLVIKADKGQNSIDMLGIAEEFLTQERIGIIVVDSVASIGKSSEIEGDIDKEVMAGAAQVMSKFLRRSMYRNVNNTTIIFINQVREKIAQSYGNPEDAPGGRALKHYSHGIVRVSKVGKYIEEGGKVIGQTVRLRMKKSKFCSPNNVTDFVLYYKKGFDEHTDVFEIAYQEGIVTRRGSNYYYGEVSLGSGKELSIQHVKDNQEVYDGILEDLTRVNSKRAGEEDAFGEDSESIERGLKEEEIEIEEVDLKELEKNKKESPIEMLNEEEEGEEEDGE